MVLAQHLQPVHGLDWVQKGSWLSQIPESWACRVSISLWTLLHLHEWFQTGWRHFLDLDRVFRLIDFFFFFSQAIAHFETALQSCLRTSFHNKRAILLSLIPANLTRRRIPTVKLLEKYQLTELYLPLVKVRYFPQVYKLKFTWHERSQIFQAVREGNLQSFNRIVEEQGELFIKLGVYVWIHQMKLLVYRSLFRKVYHMSESSFILNFSFSFFLFSVNTGWSLILPPSLTLF